jgi:competence protein ComEC
MPFGLDGVFWWLMGVGIDWMIVVTEWVAALPGAIGRMAAFGIGPLIASSIGIVLLGMLRTPLRWSGAVVLLLATAWALLVPQPDVLISGDGHNVGVRGRDGRLHLMRSAKDAFLVKEWLAADADPRLPADASLADGVACDEAGCVAPLAGGALVTLALRPEALADDCTRAVLVVTASQPPSTCAAPVITLERLRRQGVLALRRSRAGFVVDAVKPNGFDRPWSPTSAADHEDEAALLRAPGSPRAVDATPAEADQQSED